MLPEVYFVLSTVAISVYLLAEGTDFSHFNHHRLIFAILAPVFIVLRGLKKKSLGTKTSRVWTRVVISFAIPWVILSLFLPWKHLPPYYYQIHQDAALLYLLDSSSLIPILAFSPPCWPFSSSDQRQPNTSHRSNEPLNLITKRGKVRGIGSKSFATVEFPLNFLSSSCWQRVQASIR